MLQRTQMKTQYQYIFHPNTSKGQMQLELSYKYHRDTFPIKIQVESKP